MIERYITDHIAPQSDLLHRLERATHLRSTQPRMMSGHLQGELLRLLVMISGARTVLELGTFTGYSAICMAMGLPVDQDGEPRGVVHTVDVNDELQGLSAQFFAESGFNIVQHTGRALTVVPQLLCDQALKSELGVGFDFVFIDADKREYVDYYNMLMDGGMVHSGSLIVADNVLWSGKVVQEPAPRDAQSVALMAFNDMVASDERVDKVIIPLRDGLSVIRVK